MIKAEEDDLSVDELCALWNDRQHSFEMHIRTLLEKSNKLLQEINKSLEVPEEQDQQTLVQKQLKLKELIIHLTEELQRRLVQTNTKKRLQEWIMTMDKMRAKIKNISQSLLKLGLTDAAVINKLCDSQEYTQSEYEALTQELENCKKLRRQHLMTLTDYVNKEVNKWYELTLQFPPARKCGKEFYNEKQLKALEQKIIELKDFYDSNREIFELYAKRVKYWSRMEALEEKSNAPDRFYNRGGQLLGEERERKVVNLKLPQIEEELGRLVLAYTERTMKPFLVYGQEIIDRMSADWTDFRAAKDKHPNSRKFTSYLSCTSLQKISLREPLPKRQECHTQRDHWK